MNSLANELRLNILSFLPGNDVTKFKRLNSFFGGLIEKNRKHLPKPTIGLTIGMGPLNTMFSLRVKESYCLCYFGADGKLILQPKKSSEGMMSLKEAFLDFAYQQPAGVSQKNLFFKWLLNKHDLEFMEIQPYVKLYEMYSLLEETMESVKFRCPSVVMKQGNYSLHYACPGLGMEFLPKLLKTRLYVSFDKNIDGNMYPLCIGCCVAYSNFFSDVFCESIYINILLVVSGISKIWKEGYRNAKGEMVAFKSMKFGINFKYDCQITSILTRMVSGQIVKSINREYSIENITKEQFGMLADFEAFENLPEEIIWKRNSDDKMMKMKLAKGERSVMMTVEVE